MPTKQREVFDKGLHHRISLYLSKISMRENLRKRDATGQRTGSSSLSAGEAGLAGGELPLLRRGVDYRAIREAITIGQILDLCGWQPVSRSGPQLRGRCPIHKSSSDRSRSFSVNLDTNMFQCFGCGGKGNQLDLYMAVTGLPIFEAALDLACRFQLNQTTNKK